MLRSAEAARVTLKTTQPVLKDEEWGRAADDQQAGAAIRELTKNEHHRWPFDVVVSPVCQSSVEDAADVTPAQAASPGMDSCYIYCGITHAYSDGASGQALFGDLLRYYAEHLGAAPAQQPAEPAEHLALLQRRLRRSLRGRLRGEEEPNDDVYHEIVCEDWGKRMGLERRFLFAPLVLNTLRFAAGDVLGCSIDIAWLTAIVGALFRLFPKEPCIRLVLKTGCRDGPGEREMVGFLSEQRTFPVDVGDPETASILEIANIISSTRRARSWRAPVPFEASLCVYVNIVSAMVDGLPPDFRHVVRSSSVGSKWSTDAYSHVNLRIDQLSADDWDFRIFHWDATWGWEWSTYFANALGAVISDMAIAPTAPLLRACPPQSQISTTADGPSGVEPRPTAKRKATSSNGDARSLAGDGSNARSEAGLQQAEDSSDNHSHWKVPRTLPDKTCGPELEAFEADAQS